MLTLCLSLLMSFAMGAQCNTTSNEVPVGSAIQIYHANATIEIGKIY